MDNCDPPSHVLTTYPSESDEESFFSPSKPTRTHSRVAKPPISSRLIRGRHAWSPHERRQYLAFLKEQFDLMDRPVQQRRALNVYWLMAANIRSKTHAQCRIRHTALLRRYKDTENVIKACQRDMWGSEMGKMQQYGLRVGEEQCEDAREEEELWTVLQSSQQSYCQNGCTP